MKSELWKGRIRFCLLGEYYFHQDLFELTFPHIGKIIIVPADTRVKNLKDPKFGVKGLGATGSHLFAIIEEPDTIQEIYKKCILLQHCLLTIPTYKEIAVDPGYQQLLIDYKTNLSDEEIQKKFTSTSISYGIEIYKEGSFITYGGGIYSKQQINQKTFEWNGEIEAINSNHPFLKELTNSLYLLNLSYINPRSYLSIILRVSSIEALVKPNEISEELSKYIDDVGKGINELKLKDIIKNSIKGRIRNIKYESIRQSCLSYVKLNCEKLNEESGEYYSKIFDNAYQIRSSFLHDGESPLKLLKDIEGIEKYLDLEEDLQAIAKHLIAKKIKNT